MPVAQAPGGRYDVPSRSDCVVCHGGAAVPVLGFGALQLSPDRDPNAVHAMPVASHVDLRSLVARGLLRGLPAALLAEPPRIPAATPLERAALGYLQANCAHCHNHDGQPVPVRLTLSHSVSSASASHARVLQSMVDAGSRYRPPGGPAEPQVVVPGQPGLSVLALRMRSRHPQVQMPPIGTRIADPEGLALIERWIASDLSQAPHSPEKQP
jgi:mono/diheme cytochrome c family protein